jgi:Protein of unknown function (DUF3800)
LVLLAYLDESFSKDWYFMAALLCDGEGAQAIGAGLDAVVQKAVGAYGVADDAELHGYELFQGEGWWSTVKPRARIGVYNQAFQVIADNSKALERTNDYCKSHGQHVLAIADEVGEQAVHRLQLARYRKQGTDGYRSRRLTQFVDTLHFAPSHASRLIQAIDLVTFLYRRMATHTEADPRASRANTALWARVTPLIAHQHCWYPA